MSVLSDVLTDYRADLVTAGFSNLPENVDLSSMPASALHQMFALQLEAGHEALKLFGGGVVEYMATIKLTCYWDPEVDGEAIHNTIADDMTTIMGVMLKTSNRPSGCLRVWPQGRPRVIKEDSAAWFSEMLFDVTFRETQDTT